MNYFSLLYLGNAGTGGGGGGGGGGGATLNDATYSDSVIDPDNASASVSVGGASGQVSGTGGATYTWLNTGVYTDYQVRATVNSGSVSSGTTGSWLTPGQTWSRTRTVFGTSSVNLTLEIRRVSDSVVVASAVVSLEATVDI